MTSSQIKYITSLKARDAEFLIVMVATKEYHRDSEHLQELPYAGEACWDFCVALAQVTSQFRCRFIVHTDVPMPDEPSLNKLVSQGSLHRYEPSYIAVRATLTKLCEPSELTANPEDDPPVALICLSGHGWLDANNKGYLCLADTETDRLPATALAFSDLVTIFTHEHYQPQGTTLVMDTCHSGNLRKELRNLIGTLKHNDNKNKVFEFLMSCDEDQPSYQSSYLKKSILIHFLTEGLRHKVSQSDQPIIVEDWCKSAAKKTFQHFESYPTYKPQEPIFDHAGDRRLGNPLIAGIYSYKVGESHAIDEFSGNSLQAAHFKTLCDLAIDNYPLAENFYEKARERTRSQFPYEPRKELYDAPERVFKEFCEMCDSQLLARFADIPAEEFSFPFSIQELSNFDDLLEPVVLALSNHKRQNLTQKFEEYKIKNKPLIKEKLNASGLKTDLTDLCKVVDLCGLTPINVSRTNQEAYEAFREQASQYRSDFSRHIVSCAVKPSPKALAKIRHKLLANYDLLDGESYLIAIEHEVITDHEARLVNFERSAKPVIAQQMHLDREVQDKIYSLGKLLKEEITKKLLNKWWGEHRKKLQACKAKVLNIVRDRLPEELKEADGHRIHDIIASYDLANLMEPLLAIVTESYNCSIDEYEKQVFYDLHRYDPFNPLVHKRQWKSLAKSLGLSEHTTSILETRCTERYNQEKFGYEQKAQDIVEQHGKLMTREKLLEQLQADQDAMRLLQTVTLDICQRQIDRYAERCDRYEREYARCANDCYPLTNKALEQLASLKSSICSDDSHGIEAKINHSQEQKIAQYKEQLPSLIDQIDSIDSEVIRNELEFKFRTLRESIGLGAATVQPFDEQTIVDYQQMVNAYRDIVKHWLVERRETLQNPEVIGALKDQQGSLRDSVVARIHEEVVQYVQQLREKENDDWRKKFRKPRRS